MTGAGSGRPAAYRRANGVYLWPLLTREDRGSAFPVILESGHGVRVRDIEGHEYIDLMSGGSRASALGYGQRRIVEAVAEQMGKLHYAGTASLISDVTIELAEKLAQLTPGRLSTTVFSSSGSEANEVALKLARLYQRERGKPRAYKVISRWFDFHGSVGAAQEASDWLGVRAPAEPGIPGVSRIPTPDPYRIGFDLDEETFWNLSAEYLAEHIEREDPELVTAFLIEPIAQANGVQVPPPGYLTRVREICAEYNVVFIADEMITGFGRTGEWFAVDHWDVEPDIVTVGKAITGGYLPLAATVFTEEIRDAISRFSDVHTFAGHASASVAALTAISIYEDEHLVERAAKTGAKLRERLQRLSELSVVGQVRGLGMWLAVDFTSDKSTKGKPEPRLLRQTVLRSRELGVLVAQNGTSIELAPPLVIEEADLYEGVDAFEQAIRETFG